MKKSLVALIPARKGSERLKNKNIVLLAGKPLIAHTISAALKTKIFDYYNEDFFTTLKNIDTIYFEKTINMFQDLNTLFIIFYEKDSDKSLIGSNNNNTKKIYLRCSNPKNKKTIRR